MTHKQILERDIMRAVQKYRIDSKCGEKKALDSALRILGKYTKSELVPTKFKKAEKKRKWLGFSFK